MRRCRLVLVLAGCAAVLAGGCGNPSSGSEQSASADQPRRRPRVSPEIRQQARELYDKRCAPCHGATGAGDGPNGVVLDPRPRNYTDSRWQRTISDDKIARTIIEGGAEVSLSPTMPSNPDLKRKPELVSGLVEIIRDFAREEGERRARSQAGR